MGIIIKIRQAIGIPTLILHNILMKVLKLCPLFSKSQLIRMRIKIMYKN